MENGSRNNDYSNKINNKINSNKNSSRSKRNQTVHRLRIQFRSALLFASILCVLIIGMAYAAPASDKAGTSTESERMKQTETEILTEADTESGTEAETAAGTLADTEAETEPETEEDPYAQAVSDWLMKTASGIQDNVQDALEFDQQRRHGEYLLDKLESVYDLIDRITEETPWLIRVNKGTCTVTVYRKLDVEKRVLMEDSPQDSDNTAYLITDSELAEQNEREAQAGEIIQVLIPVYSCPCSVGANGGTPNGTFSIQDHLRWHELIGPTWGQWCCHFAPSYLFHSLPYDRPNDPYSLQQDVYNLIGQAASHGCVRLTAIDAKYIFDHVPVGGQVEIFEGSEEDDPLGTPERPYIGEWEHSYDPTDPELPENQNR